MAARTRPRDSPRAVRAAAAVLGRRGGKIGGLSRSPAKIAAVRENGKLGGRPRKRGKPKA